MLLTTEETQETLRNLVRTRQIWAWTSRDCFLRQQIIYTIVLNPGNEFPRAKEYTQAEAERFLRRRNAADAILESL